MTYETFIAELNKSGLSVKRFADLMGMKPNSISNNKKRGAVPTHLAVIASLLAEMSSRQMEFEPVFARLSPSPKKARGAAQTGRFAGDKQGVLELRL